MFNLDETIARYIAPVKIVQGIKDGEYILLPEDKPVKKDGKLISALEFLTIAGFETSTFTAIRLTKGKEEHYIQTLPIGVKTSL